MQPMNQSVPSMYRQPEREIPFQTMRQQEKKACIGVRLVKLTNAASAQGVINQPMLCREPHVVIHACMQRSKRKE
jgi:hypothetical protein